MGNDEQGKPVVTSVTRIQTGNDDVLYEERYKPCFLWTLILAPCCLPVVWKYHVIVTRSNLQIGYSAGCAQLTVDRSNIISVEEIDHVSPLFDWGGWGIRKQLPSWDTGYMPKAGKGVRMTIRDATGKERGYTFICDDPTTVCNLLTS